LVGITNIKSHHQVCVELTIPDQPWIALTHCDRSNGAWAVCSQQGDPTTLQPGSYCSCTNAASSTLAFSDTETLTSICSLPKATGQSIQWFAGFIPTAPPPPATTGPGGPSSGSNGGSPTASNTRSSASNSNNGNTSSRTSGAASPSETGSSPSDPNGSGNGATVLDQGAKIGIGIGVALGILLVLGLIAFLLLRLRRRRREARKSYEVESSAFNEPKPKTSMAEANRLSTAPTVAEADSRPVSEADGTPARPWSMRSELEGDRPEGPVVKGATPAVPVRSAKELSPVAELPGSEPAPEARRAP